MTDEANKFKVGDKVLFMNRKYRHTEGVIISVVVETRDRFGTPETNFYYKLRYGWLNRTMWRDQNDVKGTL